MVTWLVFRDSSNQIYWDRRTSVAGLGIKCYSMSPFARDFCVCVCVCLRNTAAEAERPITVNHFKTNNQTLCTFASSIVVSIRPSRQINIETGLQINFPFSGSLFGLATNRRTQRGIRGRTTFESVVDSQCELANGTNGATSYPSRPIRSTHVFTWYGIYLLACRIEQLRSRCTIATQYPNTHFPRGTNKIKMEWMTSPWRSSGYVSRIVVRSNLDSAAHHNLFNELVRNHFIHTHRPIFHFKQISCMGHPLSPPDWTQSTSRAPHFWWPEKRSRMSLAKQQIRMREDKVRMPSACDCHVSPN